MATLASSFYTHTHALRRVRAEADLDDYEAGTAGFSGLWHRPHGTSSIITVASIVGVVLVLATLGVDGVAVGLGASVPPVAISSRPPKL